MNEPQQSRRQRRADRKATEKKIYHGRTIDLPDDIEHSGPALKRLAARRRSGILEGYHTYLHVTKGFRIRQPVALDHLLWRLQRLRSGQGFGPKGAV